MKALTPPLQEDPFTDVLARSIGLLEYPKYVECRSFFIRDVEIHSITEG